MEAIVWQDMKGKNAGWSLGNRRQSLVKRRTYRHNHPKWQRGGGDAAIHA
jgi:hypothetical protein